MVGPGYESLMTADYSQIEMRIMAHLSEDELLIEAFRSGQDFHSITAARVFGVPADEVTRRAARQDQGDELRPRLRAVRVRPRPAARHRAGRGARADGRLLRRRFGGVRDYLGGVVDEARKSGFTETIMGRRRYLPDLNSDNRQRRETAERMALNAPIQGSAADLIKIAMLGVDAAITRRRPALADAAAGARRARVRGRAGGAGAARRRWCAQQMGGAAELAVPLDVSVGFGRSWHEAAH